MTSHYKRIGDYVTQIKTKNTDGTISSLKGININKHFMPSVANVNGTDLSTYRVVKKNQFAFNPMHVGRDEVLPIALLEDDESVIVSPAYVVFEVNDEQELLPAYLMMWCSRSEFDRNAWFMTDNSVRGGFSWNDFCELKLPVPSIEKQREIVREYNVVNDRIALNEQLIQKLEDTAQTIYKKWFVDFEFPISKEYAESIGKPELEGKPYKSSGGEMRYNQYTENSTPINWFLSEMREHCSVITKGTTPKLLFESKQPNLIPYFRGNAITEQHNINEDKFSYIEQNTHKMLLKRSIVYPNDLLFTITGTLGNFALVPTNIPESNTNQNVAILRVNSEKISPQYIYWLWLCNWQNKFIQENTQQAVQANLNLTMMGDMPILELPYQDISCLMSLINPIVEYRNKILMKQKLLKNLCVNLMLQLAKL